MSKQKLKDKNKELLSELNRSVLKVRNLLINAYVHTTPEKYPSTGIPKPLYRNSIKKFNHFPLESFKYNKDTKHLYTYLNMLPSL